MPSDLEIAFNALQAKQDHYTKLWDYYDGDQPLIYSSRRLQEAFNRLNARFVQDWLAVVVDAVQDRLKVKRYNVANNDQLTNRLNDLLITTELILDAPDTHLAMLVTGESFVIVWPDDDGVIQAYYNDPRLCAIFYEANNPRRKRLGAKWWVDEAGKRRMTLYYRDRLEYYVSKAKVEHVTAAAALRPIEDGALAPNPYNIIPLFHFRRERRKTCGEFEKVITLQDAINKLLADMMVSAEFGAYRQRYVISQASTGQLKNAPSEIWDLPAGDGEGQGTSVGEFSATELKNFYETIDKLANSIAIITRTPKHFLFGQGGTPSGEALIALESPLNDKAEGYIDRISPVWQAVGQFLLQLDGTIIDKQDISVIMADPRTIQPLTQAQIRQTNANAGYPLVTQLRDEGKTESEIEQMEQDKEDEQQGQQQNLAAGILNAQRMLDSGEGGNGMERPE
jgi:hypothetical protein